MEPFSSGSTGSEAFYSRVSPYIIPLIIGAGSLVIIISSIVWAASTAQTQKPIEFSRVEAVPSGQVAGDTVGEIVVDVAGAVENPGVYHLPAGSRVEDAISAAGGMSQGADMSQISKSLNRAAVLITGGKVYVPAFGDMSTSYNSDDTDNKTQTSYNINTEQQTIGASQNQTGILISVNNGSYQQLIDLPGVGPATANKLISGRPYQSLQDLVNKKILGTKLFDKLKDSLTL